tara:strand:+ start:982 stop:2748 length:1767 start_codon:yes stop_codon:yes gene_type:complete
MFVIGIHDGHHCGAAIFKDKKIICAISEERLTRKKNEYGFPLNSIEYCLRKANIKKEQVSYVAFSTKHLPPRYMMVKRNTTFSLEDYKLEQEKYWYSIFYTKKKNPYLKIFKNKIQKSKIYDYKKLKNEDDEITFQSIRKEGVRKFLKINDKNIFFFDHHECHAYYAFYSSPDRSKLDHVFTCDGGGDKSNGTIWKVLKNNKLKEIYRTNIANIGRIYRYVVMFLNMKPSENEFKVMGLAGYSSIKSEYNVKASKIFFDVLDVSGFKFFYKKKIKDLYFYFYEKLKNYRFDSIGFAVQYFTEQLLLKWFNNSQKIFKCKRVAFAGGVSQNIKAIKLILENTKIKHLYVPPGAGDESLSIGAIYAFFASANLFDKKISDLKNPYIGLSYKKKDLDFLLKDKSIKVSKTSDKKVAKILAKSKPVARFLTIKSEFGPRALGNRSILADPRNQDIINYVNRKIKIRDFWMPFAPSILDKHLKKYIIDNNEARPYHMTYSYDSTDLAKKHIPAALHPFDKTTRPQVVTLNLNTEYYNLINEFYKITGVGALLNTSFNLHGEPIVSDPKSAIRTFKKSGLEYLYIDKYLVEKKK